MSAPTLLDARGKARYCVIGVFYADLPGTPQLLADEGRILVWSTPSEARSFLPRLGGSDRRHVWSADRETITWLPLDLRRESFNRAVILTGYDPYDVPANGIPGIRSEARGRDWHSHKLWTEHMKSLLAWVDGLESVRTNGARE